MTTDALCATDAYLRACDATVLDSADDGIVLNRTVAYARGGGQPGDTGWLEWAGGRAAFLDTVKSRDTGRYLHVLADDAVPPPAGTAVTVTIDWVRRHQLMRTHTALHILCGTVFRDYGALVTGGEMEPGKGRLDFEFETMRGELVREIEAAINKEAAQGREIRVQILPREEAFQIPDPIRTKINLLPAGITHVRTVEIVGLDLQADGGTHVRNTSEVGAIRVADYKSKGAINKRIYIEIE